MSVKDFFAFANIKQTVIEFLKNKSDFESLCAKHKKPFRGHINRHLQAPTATPGKDTDHHEPPSTDPYSDYFVSDGFNSIKCHFSDLCKEAFGKMYP